MSTADTATQGVINIMQFIKYMTLLRHESSKEKIIFLNLFSLSAHEGLYFTFLSQPKIQGTLIHYSLKFVFNRKQLPTITAKKTEGLGGWH